MDIKDHDINYLSPAEIYEIAEQVLGRRPDVRDRHLLRAAAARPLLRAFGESAYPTLLDKAAALLHALAAHHLFYDGNKRTATQATLRFLQENGLRPTWTDQEIYQFVLEIAQSQHDVDTVADWLAAHTIPQDNNDPLSDRR
jgi:death-on-curing protein